MQRWSERRKAEREKTLGTIRKGIKRVNQGRVKSSVQTQRLPRPHEQILKK